MEEIQFKLMKAAEKYEKEEDDMVLKREHLLKVYKYNLELLDIVIFTNK